MERDWNRLSELMGQMSKEREKLLLEKIKETDMQQKEYEKNFYLQVDSYRFYNQAFGTNKRGIEPHVHQEILERHLNEYAEELHHADVEEHEKQEQELQPELSELEEMEPEDQTLQNAVPEKKADNVITLRDYFNKQMGDMAQKNSGQISKDLAARNFDSDLNRAVKMLEERWASEKQEKDVSAQTKDNVISLRDYFKDQKEEVLKEPDYEDMDVDMDEMDKDDYSDRYE